MTTLAIFVIAAMAIVIFASLISENMGKISAIITVILVFAAVAYFTLNIPVLSITVNQVIN